MALCQFTYKHIRLNSLSTSKTLQLGLFKLHLSTSSSSTVQTENSEYTDTPVYPKILDLSPKSVQNRERDHKLDKLKKVGTIEEKLIGINMPRYYGWSSLMLHEGNYPLNFLPFVQHITRTDFLKVESFPFTSSNSQSEVNNAIDKIRPQLQNALVMEISKRRHCHIVNGSAESMGEGELSDEVTKGVVEQINRVLTVNLAHLAPHLYETEVDVEPRIEAFWRVGGFNADQETYDSRVKDIEDHKKELKSNRFAKRKISEEPDDPVGHFIQYLGHPVLQLRHANPLKPLEPQSIATGEGQVEASLNAQRQPDLTHIPVVKYDPGFYGLEKIRRHGTNIPGFWPGDPHEFGLLSYHGRGHLLGRPPSFGDEDESDTVNAQALLAGYAWLLGQANYQGFSTFHELTYPLTTSTVVTDGRIFSFFVTQLNTLLMHDEFIDTNPKFNVCYALPTYELFQKIEGDEIVGWDDRVLALLVQAYLNAPAERVGVDLKPYVDKAAPFVQNIEHEERRMWLHKNFRHFFANRPRHIKDPEIWDWEMIYKVKFQMRPMDARRRFFEIGVDPFKRRLDDRVQDYIPKKFRDPDNKKKKFYNAYWPDC